MILSVPANDHGRLYIFEISAKAASAPDRLAQKLGLPTLNPDYVDIVPLVDIEDKGIVWYLNAGYDITPNAQETVDLSSITNHMLIVMSRAFGGDGARITLPDTMRHVTTLAIPGMAMSATPLQSDAAKGLLPPVETKAPQERPPSRIWMYILLALFAFFALMAWRVATGNV